MRELGDQHDLEPFGFARMFSAANRLYQEDARMEVGYLIEELLLGDLNNQFRLNPKKALDEFADQEITPQFKRDILDSFDKLITDKVVHDDDGAIRKIISDLRSKWKFDVRVQERAIEVVPITDHGKPVTSSPLKQEVEATRSPQLLTSADSLSLVDPSQLSDGDPITKAIREQVLEAERQVVVKHLIAKQLISDSHGALDSLKKYRDFCLNQSNKDKLDPIFADQRVKVELYAAALEGQQKVMQQFSSGTDKGKGPHFSKLEWSSPTTEANITIKSHKVQNHGGSTIFKLEEVTEKFATPKKCGELSITESRTIDLPGDTGDTTVHLSLVLKDAGGKSPSKKEAVYFTAHYEKGKLVEMSTPTPVKFAGTGKDAICYIENNGKIYTLPVTKEKYESMMRTIVHNQGQVKGKEQVRERRGRESLPVHTPVSSRHKPVGELHRR